MHEVQAPKFSWWHVLLVTSTVGLLLDQILATHFSLDFLPLWGDFLFLVCGTAAFIHEVVYWRRWWGE
jgi:hypothetical protein